MTKRPLRGLLLAASLVMTSGLSVCGGTSLSASNRSATHPGASSSHHQSSVTTQPRPKVDSRRGYWLLGADGGVFAVGDSSFHGSVVGQSLNRVVVCMSSTPSGAGYWLVAADGGIFGYGDAAFYGSTATMTLSRPIVAMARTSSGTGYWLVAADGGVFGFGDAIFYGSAAGLHPAQPIVGLSPTPSGNGYWLVGADGGVFNFGDAGFYGSTAAMHLAQPIVGLSPTPSGNGYWLVGADGGVFNFGDAGFYGAANGMTSGRTIVSFGPTPTGHGYWITAADGTVYSFGDAPTESAPGSPLAAPIIGMATIGQSGVCHAVNAPTDIAGPAGTSQGHWTPVGATVGGSSVIYTTTLSPRSGVPPAGLAWIATNQVITRLYAAPGQPPGSFPYSGFVDPTSAGALLAAFNSGFMVFQSAGGWSAYGQTAIPLQNGAASLVIRSDGSATVGMWGRDVTASPSVVAVRQNLSMLVDGGRPAVDLSVGAWGATLGGVAATWRSGLGVDALGNLIYVGGPSMLPSDLAQLLIAAGCIRAMELDINPQWVTFSSYVVGQGTLLLPSMTYGPGHFLSPSGRDFVAMFAP